METRIRPVTPIPIGKLLSAQLPPTTLINDKKRRAEVFAECCRFVCPGFKVEGAFRKIMNDIFLYAEGDSGAGKGLLLTGDYGTTFILHCLWMITVANFANHLLIILRKMNTDEARFSRGDAMLESILYQ